MRKKIIHNALLVLALMILGGCEKNEAPLKPNPILTRSEALNIVLDKIVGDYRKNKAVWSLTDSLKKSEPVYISGNANRPFQVDYTSWFFFVDSEYLIGPWPHNSRYVFVDVKNGSYKVFFSSYPPLRFSDMDTVFAWAKSQTKSLPPLTFSGKGSGCRNLDVHKLNEEYTAVLIVKADTAQLHLSTQMKQFDLSHKPNGLAVYIDFYHYLPENNDFIGNLYCTDIGYSYYPPQK